jgi:hypothetical protein
VLLTRKLVKKLLSTPGSNPSSYMTCLVTGSEAFELDSKAGSPETLSPLWRVSQFYHARLCPRSLLVSSSVSSLLAAPKRSDTTPRLARILPDAHPKRVERGAAAALAQFAAILTRFNGFSL